MIPEERLKAFAEYEKGILDDWEIVAVANEILPDMASELLEARRKIGILKEDAERLVGYLVHDADCAEITNPEAECNCFIAGALDQHNQVMKEVE